MITQQQVWAGVVPVGPKGTALNSSYNNRDRPEYKRDLGMAIVNFAQVVPDGLLVFFPSYAVMNNSIEFWQSENTWARLAMKKALIVEPRAAADFPDAVNEFKSALSRGGAIFFGVCRGKISEGLDFADRAGRSVILTGIPFAAKGDPRVELKKQYLDRDARLAGVNGDYWYRLQAFRAVNQAVGRVIRHKDDYGAIILLDERFAGSHGKLSKWMQPHLRNYNKFGEAIKGLSFFFRTMQASNSMKNGGTTVREQVPVPADVSGVRCRTGDDIASAQQRENVRVRTDGLLDGLGVKGAANSCQRLTGGVGGKEGADGRLLSILGRKTSSSGNPDAEDNGRSQEVKKLSQQSGKE